MTTVLMLSEPGGLDRLSLTSLPVPDPGPGEVRVDQTHAGVNFVDIYHRKGLYPLPAYPGVVGMEGLGRVTAVGVGVTSFAPGDRVAYAGGVPGSYATARVLPAERLVAVPDDLSDAQVAGTFLRGLTAWLLVERVLPPGSGAGKTVLVHAAAGGLGLVLCQWLARRGWRVLGTVGSAEKADLARAHGVDDTIAYKETDVVAAVKDLTGGRGVDAVVEGIGGDTTLQALEVLAPFGMVANVGSVAAAVPPIDIHRLINRFLIRPSIMAAVADFATYHQGAQAWFAMVRAGLAVPVPRDYALTDGVQAQADMEAGRTTGGVRLCMEG